MGLTRGHSTGYAQGESRYSADDYGSSAREFRPLPPGRPLERFDGRNFVGKTLPNTLTDRFQGQSLRRHARRQGGARQSGGQPLDQGFGKVIVDGSKHITGCIERVFDFLCYLCVRRRRTGWQSLVTYGHQAHPTLHHREVIGLGQRDLAHLDVFAPVCWQPGVLQEAAGEARIHLVPVFGQGVRLPAPVLVTVGRPTEAGQRFHRSASQVEGHPRAEDGHFVAHAQLGDAVTLIAEEQQRRRVGALVLVGGKVVAQNLDRFRHHHVGDVILLRVGKGGHLQRGGERHAQPVGDGDGGRQRRVETASNARVGHLTALRIGDHADVAPIVLVLIAAGQIGLLQAQRHQPQPVVVLAVLRAFGSRVFPGNRHVCAVVFAHRQPGEVPVIVVGVDDLGVVQQPALPVLAPGFGSLGRAGGHGAAIVGEHLDEPDDAHLLRLPQARPVRRVGDTRAKSRPPPAGLVSNDVERDEERHAAISQIARRSAVGPQRPGVNHPVRIGAVGHVGDGGAGGGVASRLEHQDVPAVGQRQQVAVGNVPRLPVRDLTQRNVEHAAAARAGVNLGGDRRCSLELEAQPRGVAHLRQVHGGRKPGGQDRRRRADRPGGIHALNLHAGAQRRRQRQGELAAREFHFEHGNEARVAVGAARVVGRVLRAHIVGELRIVASPALHLAVFIAAGPVQHVERVGQVIGDDRTELQVNQNGIVGVQPVDYQLEGTLAVEGSRRTAHDGSGGRINPVGDAVAVIVAVEQVWRAVPVSVGASLRGCPQARTFKGVWPAVVVRIHRVGVEVPVLSAKIKAAHLGPIEDAVAIGVGKGWLGAQAQHLPTVPQTVAISIGSFRVGLVLSLLAIGQTVLIAVLCFLVVGAGDTDSHATRARAQGLRGERVAQRVPIRSQQLFLKVARRRLRFLLLLQCGLSGGLALREGRHLIALEQRGKNHGDDQRQRKGSVNLLRATVGDEQNHQPDKAQEEAHLAQCTSEGRSSAPSLPLPGTWQPQRAGNTLPKRGSKKPLPVKPRKIGLDLRFDLIAVLLGRKHRVDHQP